MYAVHVRLYRLIFVHLLNPSSKAVWILISNGNWPKLIETIHILSMSECFCVLKQVNNGNLTMKIVVLLVLNLVEFLRKKTQKIHLLQNV